MSTETNNTLQNEEQALQNCIQAINNIFVNMELAAKALYTIQQDYPHRMADLRTALEGRLNRTLELNLIALAKGELIAELITDNGFLARSLSRFTLEEQKDYYVNEAPIDVYIREEDHTQKIISKRLNVHEFTDKQRIMVFDIKLKKIRTLEEQANWVSSQGITTQIEMVKASEGWEATERGVRFNRNTEMSFSEMEKILELHKIRS